MDCTSNIFQSNKIWEPFLFHPFQLRIRERKARLAEAVRKMKSESMDKTMPPQGDLCHLKLLTYKPFSIRKQFVKRADVALTFFGYNFLGVSLMIFPMA